MVKTNQNPMQYQSQIVRAITASVMSRQYSQLAMFLEMLSRSINDEEMLLKVQTIKENCSFEFETFCVLYLKSFGMPQHRGIRFMGTGHRLLWPQVRQMAIDEFVSPLNQIAIELIGRVSKSKGTELQNFLSVVASASNSVTNDKTQTEVDFDLG